MSVCASAPCCDEVCKGEMASCDEQCDEEYTAPVRLDVRRGLQFIVSWNCENAVDGTCTGLSPDVDLSALCFPHASPQPNDHENPAIEDMLFWGKTSAADGVLLHGGDSLMKKMSGIDRVDDDDDCVDGKNRYPFTETIGCYPSLSSLPDRIGTIAIVVSHYVGNSDDDKPSRIIRCSFEAVGCAADDDQRCQVIMKVPHVNFKSELNDKVRGPQSVVVAVLSRLSTDESKWELRPHNCNVPEIPISGARNGGASIGVVLSHSVRKAAYACHMCQCTNIVDVSAQSERAAPQKLCADDNASGGESRSSFSFNDWLVLGIVLVVGRIYLFVCEYVML